MSNSPKYFTIQRVIESFEDRDAFDESVNLAEEDGYRVHTFTAHYEQGEQPGIGSTRYIALMSLKSDSKYENISNMKDVSPREVDGYLADGWKVADSWSKIVRMVRPFTSSMIKEDEN